MEPAYIWTPDPATAAATNVARMIVRCGAADISELRRRSTADIGWWWGEVIDDLSLPFSRPWSQIVDVSDGLPFPKWFCGAGFNVVQACVRRWAEDPAHADRVALVHRTEDGATESTTYAKMADQVAAAAAGLRRLGIGRGDAVALFMPMCPEAVVAGYAIAAVGALLVPLFSGYAPGAISTRLVDGDVKAVVTADTTVRGGKVQHLEPVLAAALADAPTVQHVVVVRRGTTLDGVTADGSEMTADRVEWTALLEGPSVTLADVVEDTDAEDPLLLGYTSGTTGKPKGAVLTQAGFTLKVTSELAYSFDVGVDDTFCWITDMGWIMGPLSMIGTHGNGATLLLCEGLPTHPDPAGLWALAVEEGVTVLGVSPTLTRTLMASAPEAHRDHDLSTIKVIGSSGEPWDPTSYTWLAHEVLGDRVPIINFSGGTEVGGSFLAPYPVEGLKAGSLGGPSLGMDADVVDAQGQPIRGAVGELICRQPWPSMTKGLWRDPDRYLAAYWSTFPDVWRHGDWAMVDEDGQWFLFGRSDEVINIAGKRIGPAEVESILATHPAVAEAAAVGVPDATKGEVIWCFWVPTGDAADTDEDRVSSELRAAVAAELGRPFAPALVRRVAALPKTRSAKTLRRAVRAAAIGADPGDLSGAENPAALDGIREAVGRRPESQP